MDVMKMIQNLICEHYIWVVSTTIMFFFAFIFVIIISGKRKKRFLTWKKEVINLGVYKSEKEYSKDDIMQELYDENIRITNENKILQKQVSDSGFWGIFALFVILIALWIRRDKRNTLNLHEKTANTTESGLKKLDNE